VLKIDRAFVASMDGSEDSFALIRTMVELGRSLGLLTLAEGIEDEHQLECLRSHNCHSGQGFMFSKPVEPAMVETLMAHTARKLRDGAARGSALPVVRPG